MKPVLTISVLTFLFLTFLFAEEKFTPRIAIDHQKYVDEALAKLLEKRPDIAPDNLSFHNLGYRFNFESATEQVCGPNGCQLKSAAPFREKLSVGFVILDSAEEKIQEGRKTIVRKGLVVHFPTPRSNEWFIGESTITEYR
ncbi:MAG: hypothetical protein P1V20_24230 [Verrucomicrobiales bacterium]|nr:hypothetical protein [Verrucomicrobiales bacterium]